MSSDTMGKVFRIVFFGLFASIGLSALLFSLWSLYVTNQSKTWPSTTGTILKAYCSASISANSPQTWTRHVRYTYHAGGKTYKSAREYFGIRISSRDCVPGYSKGQAVTVFFNPADPGEAVLKPGANTSAKFGIVFGLLFMAFSALGYWFAGKKKRPGH
jgi:hypothetical protein